MKIRKSISEGYECKVFIYHNKKEEYTVISIPDLNWSIQFEDDLYGESLEEHLVHSLFNLVDESLARELALRINQWTIEM